MTCISTFVPTFSTITYITSIAQPCLSSEVHLPLRAPARPKPSSNKSHKKPPSQTQDSSSRYTHHFTLLPSLKRTHILTMSLIRNSTNTASNAASPNPVLRCRQASQPATPSAWKNTCRPGTSCPSNTSIAYRERPVLELSLIHI